MGGPVHKDARGPLSKDPDATCSRRLAQAYIRALDKGGKYAVFVAWFALLAVGAVYGFALFDKTTGATEDLPKSALSLIADNELMGSFSFFAADADVIAVILSIDEAASTTWHDHRQAASLMLGVAVKELWSIPDLANFITDVKTPYFRDTNLGQSTSGGGARITYRDTTSFPSMLSADGTELLVTLRSPVFDFGVALTENLKPVVEQAVAKALPSLADAITVRVTSEDMIWENDGEGLERDLIVGDSISIPSALLALALTLRSGRLLVAPILSIAISTLVTFLVAVPITSVINVSEVAPNLMMSLTIALSVDYSLFILSRFREEMRRGTRFDIAVARVVATAGHTIVVSGMTLIACTMTLVLLPLDLLQSMGISASLTVTVTMVVNLTLLPAMILTFKSFFVGATRRQFCRPSSNDDQNKGVRMRIFTSKKKREREQLNSIYEEDDEDDLRMINDAESDDDDMLTFNQSLRNASADSSVVGLDTSEIVRGDSDDRADARARRSPYYSFGKRVFKRPVLTILLIAGTAAALTYPALTFKTTGGMTCECSSIDKYFQVYQHMTSIWGGGKLIPYAVVVSAEDEGVSTAELWQEAITIGTEVLPFLKRSPARNMYGMVIKDGVPVNYSSVADCFEEPFAQNSNNSYCQHVLCNPDGVNNVPEHCKTACADASQFAAWGPSSPCFDPQPAKSTTQHPTTSQATTSVTTPAQNSTTPLTSTSATRNSTTPEISTSVTMTQNSTTPVTSTSVTMTQNSTTPVTSTSATQNATVPVTSTSATMTQNSTTQMTSAATTAGVTSTMDTTVETTTPLATSTSTMDTAVETTTPLATSTSTSDSATMMTSTSTTKTSSHLKVTSAANGNNIDAPSAAAGATAYMDIPAGGRQHSRSRFSADGHATETNATSVTKTYFWLSIEADPWGADGTAWLHQARQLLKQREEEVGRRFTYHLARGGGEDVDIAAVMYEKLPIVIGAISAIVVVLMMVSFRSLAIAVKALFSISVTLCMVFGLGALVYQYGILDFTTFWGFKSMGGMCWIPPVLCISLLVGLGLDYHVFLLSRVVEFRVAGYDDKESILLGLARTGKVITAAGVIMAIAFVGLLFAREPILAQLSFYIVFAVLVDTFLVRACLIPATMAVLGRYNWWPRRMPTPTRSPDGVLYPDGQGGEEARLQLLVDPS